MDATAETPTTDAGRIPDADVLALQHLANRYWALADRTELAGIGDLFVTDGVLQLGKLRLDGVEAIERFFHERELELKTAQRTTRHLATNFLVIPLSADRARVRSTVIVYAGSGDLPLPVEAPSGIADFEDVCVRLPSRGWFYESRMGRTVFVGPGAASFAK